MSETIRISSDTVEIDAPAELVWQVIVDFASYPQWNGCARASIFAPAS
ncbi:hypothetical protein DWB85_03500 [Seongchinamella sediminis]|uniref:SRPBCC domain-containing protein n=1 Tax=Seongchinamella sediminis TaxID=2283635 RepID=A0A3L7E0M3_9GAMM|nr:hypothetical protein [Seongchinamella sediminis]RLQ23056.1 hypothetical protein DWB85_03500 [Seongchinamella sediminis]